MQSLKEGIKIMRHLKEFLVIENLILFGGSGMRDVHDLINREVMVDGKEGEITNILGVMYEITFFNLNDGKTIVDIKDIDKYLV